MRLLLLSTLYPPCVVGGAERSVEVLARELITQGVEVRVVTLTPNGVPTLEERDDVGIHRLPMIARGWPFEERRGRLKRLMWHVRDVHAPRMARSVGSILDDWCPDVLHTNTMAGFSVAVWGEAARRGIPVVHTLRDYYLLCPRASMFRNGRPCARQCIMCRALSAPKASPTRHVTTVVGNSHFILSKHLEHNLFHSSERAVIHNAYRPEQPLAERNHRSDAPTHSEQPVRFGFLGRLSTAKGLDLLLDAVHHLPSDRSWRLDIAGRGTPAEEARFKARRLAPHVRFLGFVKPATFLREIDVLVVPSLWYEPLPRTIYEAYAHGVPVLTSDRGGSPEIVDEGKTGTVFAAAQGAPALSASMSDVLQNPGRFAAMRRACIAKANAFLPSKTVARYLDVYASATARERVAAGRMIEPADRG